MLVKVLGGIDIFAGLILMFGAGIKLPDSIFLIFGIILLAKSLLGLLKDFASWIDFSCGIVFILLIFFSIHWVICLVAGILIIQKGIISFF